MDFEMKSATMGLMMLSTSMTFRCPSEDRAGPAYRRRRSTATVLIIEPFITLQYSSGAPPVKAGRMSWAKGERQC